MVKFRKSLLVSVMFSLRPEADIWRVPAQFRLRPEANIGSIKPEEFGSHDQQKTGHE